LSQAYGARKHKLMGILLYRGILIDFIYIILLTPALLYSEILLNKLGIDPLLSNYAS
jgi:Na+-driven multidrug efflux pump